MYLLVLSGIFEEEPSMQDGEEQQDVEPAMESQNMSSDNLEKHPSSMNNGGEEEAVVNDGALPCDASTDSQEAQSDSQDSAQAAESGSVVENQETGNHVAGDIAEEVEGENSAKPEEVPEEENKEEEADVKISEEREIEQPEGQEEDQQVRSHFENGKYCFAFGHR